MVREEGKIKEVRIDYSTDVYDPKDDKKVLNHSEGYEIYSAAEAAGIAAQMAQQIELAKKRKTEKVVLNNEEIKLKKMLEKIKKHEQFEARKQSLGVKFDEQVQREEEDEKKSQELLKMWREIAAKVKEVQDEAKESSDS